MLEREEEEEEEEEERALHCIVKYLSFMIIESRSTCEGKQARVYFKQSSLSYQFTYY